MVEFTEKSHYDLNDLREIVRLLRAPGGCDWDRVQTHESIRRNFLEEAYEVCEAIDECSPEHLKEELGDVLLQVFFHSSIEEDAKNFSLDEVADTVCKKLIYRHPHVFAQTEVSGADEILQNWEELKRKEKGQDTHSQSLASVARSLPALWRAEKIQHKARKAGFDWPDSSGALSKILEEAEELQEAVRQQTNVAEELGDLLFAVTNFARLSGIDPEALLHGSCDKFTRRFAHMEALATEDGQALDQLDLTEMDAYWDKAKKAEQTAASYHTDKKGSLT